MKSAFETAFQAAALLVFLAGWFAWMPELARVMT